MNGQRMWADKYAKQICGAELKPEPNLNEYLPSFMSDAYLAGLKEGFDRAAGLVERFENPKFSGIPMLIRAIGTAKLSDLQDSSFFCHYCGKDGTAYYTHHNVWAHLECAAKAGSREPS